MDEYLEWLREKAETTRKWVVEGENEMGVWAFEIALIWETARRSAFVDAIKEYKKRRAE